MPALRRSLVLSLAAAAALWTSSSPAANAPAGGGDTSLMFAARNISNPGANLYLYYTFSTQGVDFKKGDTLDYDLYLAKSNPSTAGGIDVDTVGNVSLRDTKTEDQNHLLAHPGTELPKASGHWYHRTISLDKLADRHATKWNVVAEGDARGGYIQFVDNVIVTHADGSKDVIYDNGEPAARTMAQKEGYSQSVLLKTVDRASIKDDADMAKFNDNELKRFALQSSLDGVRGEIELARKIADRV